MIKQFLKPDWRKILIFIVLIILMVISSSWFKVNVLKGRIMGGAFYEMGLPLKFYSYSSSTPFPDEPLKVSEVFKPLYLFLDIVVWYFLSCLVVWFCNKFKK